MHTHFFKISFRFLCFVLPFLLLYSCRTIDLETVPEKRYPKEIEESRQWVMAHYPEQFSINLSKETEPTMQLKANWDRAFTGSDSKEKTVEIPVVPVFPPQVDRVVQRTIVLSENVQKYKETGDERYISNLSRLVVKTNIQSKERICFIMTIIPSASYWEQTNFSPFSKVTYTDRADFDGFIFFYHMNGEFSNGWSYKNGKNSGSIKMKQPDTNQPPQE